MREREEGGQEGERGRIRGENRGESRLIYFICAKRENLKREKRMVIVRKRKCRMLFS